MAFDVETTASLLIEARRARRRVTITPPPARIEDAYAVQDATTARIGPVGAWKTGASAPGAQALAAPIYRTDIRTSPAEWPGAAFSILCVEAEIAFLIGKDLPAAAELPSEAQIRDAVASVHAAIEIVDTRLAGWPEADPKSKLADNQSNGALAYDPNGAAWSGQDFAKAPFRLLVDGRVVKEGRGGNPGGDPVPLLVWLVRHCCETRDGLKAGTVVTTGSYSGMDFVEPGQTIVAEFPDIGRTEVRFSA